MPPMFIFIVGVLVVVLAGALMLDLRSRKYRWSDDASIDQHRLKKPERPGSEFRKGGPGGIAPSDPGFGGM